MVQRQEIIANQWKKEDDDFINLETMTYQYSSVTQLCPTVFNPMDCSTPGFSITNSQSLLKLISIESVMSSNHLILCCPLLLLPSIFPRTRVFSSESVLHIRWPKFWSFRFSISPSNEYSGLISFRMKWFDLLAVQGTLKSFLQHHSSKASIFCHSAFFMVLLPLVLFYVSPWPLAPTGLWQNFIVCDCFLFNVYMNLLLLL